MQLQLNSIVKANLEGVKQYYANAHLNKKDAKNHHKL